ncbi:MAG: hypothetical protein ACJ78U_13655 [Myxococcales bacterium]
MGRRLAQGALSLAAISLVVFAWRCDRNWFDTHVFLPQQFFLRADPRIVFWCRGLAAALGLVLLRLVPALPRGASAQRLLLATVLALPAAEVVLRWRMDRVIRPELLAAMDVLTTSHPRYGTTFKPSMDRIQELSGREIRFRTDAASRRIPGAGVDPALPSLVFTGESAMAGFGLQWEETFPALLGERLQLQVVNLATPAYRIDQSWLRLKDALPGLARPVAVIGVFMPGLVGRSFAGGRHPIARPLPFSGIELLAPQPLDAFQRSGLFRVWNHLYRSDAQMEEGMRSVGATLADMAALAKPRGAVCLFLVTGYTPRWMIHELFEAQRLDAVVVDIPESELLADGHPGRHGAVRIADALEPRLRTAMARFEVHRRQARTTR